MNPNPDPPINARRGPVSSLFDRLSLSCRTAIDDAIISRDPPRLINIYNDFQLAMAGIGQAAFYRYAARLRANAALDYSARLARVEGRDPIESMSTILDAEFIRLATSDGSIHDDDRVDADPYAIEEAVLKRLHRIVLMRQRLASTRLAAERAARCKIDAVRQRGDAHIIKLTQAVLSAASPHCVAGLPGTPPAADDDVRRNDPREPIAGGSPLPAETPPLTPGTPQS